MSFIHRAVRTIRSLRGKGSPGSRGARAAASGSVASGALAVADAPVASRTPGRAAIGIACMSPPRIVEWRRDVLNETHSLAMNERHSLLRTTLLLGQYEGTGRRM